LRQRRYYNTNTETVIDASKVVGIEINIEIDYEMIGAYGTNGEV
jgi:hypothetical protein